MEAATWTPSSHGRSGFRSSRCPLGCKISAKRLPNTRALGGHFNSTLHGGFVQEIAEKKLLTWKGKEEREENFERERVENAPPKPFSFFVEDTRFWVPKTRVPTHLNPDPHLCLRSTTWDEKMLYFGWSKIEISIFGFWPCSRQIAR